MKPRYGPPLDHHASSNKEASNVIEPQPRMQTFKGRLIHPFDVQQADIDIEDIAHALALTVRYGGHCPFFYSVAQHSVLVCSVLPPELQLEGLLHDGAEAYLGDIIHPLKVHFSDYQLAESVLMQRIAARFDFGYPEHRAVKAADLAVLVTEFAQFGIPPINGEEARTIPDMLPIHETSWRVVEKEFLHKFNQLTRDA